MGCRDFSALNSPLGLVQQLAVLAGAFDLYFNINVRSHTPTPGAKALEQCLHNAATSTHSSIFFKRLLDHRFAAHAGPECVLMGKVPALVSHQCCHELAGATQGTAIRVSLVNERWSKKLECEILLRQRSREERSSRGPGSAGSCSSSGSEARAAFPHFAALTPGDSTALQQLGTWGAILVSARLCPWVL